MAKILILDDEPSLRNILTSALSDFGHEVDAAEDGRQGLEMISTTHYDLIISDNDMSKVPRGMSGPEFVKNARQKEEYKDTPIMIYTGTRIDEIRGLYEGRVQGFMAKPFKMSDLKRSVDELVLPKREIILDYDPDW